MIYSRKYKYIYLAPPKTGTSTLSHILKHHFDGSYWDFSDVFKIRTSYSQPANYHFARHLSHVPEALKEYFIFASIRNPYFHALSLYKHDVYYSGAISSNKHFAEFLSSDFLKNCSLVFLLNRHKQYEPPKGCVSFSIHQYVDTENLEEDFFKLPFVKDFCYKRQKINMQERIEVPVLHKIHGNKIFYNDEMANKLIEQRSLDFKFFEYSTDLPQKLKCPAFL